MTRARSPYYLLAVTLVVMLAMLGLTIGAAIKIHALNRQIQTDNVLATVEGTARLLDTWERQYSRSLPLLTEDPLVKRHVAALIATHARGEITDDSELLSFETYFAPRRSAMGYRGYLLISTDSTLLATSTTGTAQQRIRNPALLEQAQHVLRDNKPIIRPLTFGTSGTPSDPRLSMSSFMLCAPIEPTPTLRAVLCLRIDASEFFIQALSATRVGRTGETYIIDRDGRILSPSRFIQAPIAANLQQPTAPRPSLWARTPPYGMAALATASPDERYPLTAVAASMVRDGASGFMEGYLDYRRVPVIGAGRWIGNLGIGLIVEQEMAEAYSAHRAARAVMLGLSTMEIFLVGALAGIFMRGRRDLAVREARIRHLLTHIPAMVFLKDGGGRLQLLNPAFETETGIKGGRSRGKVLEEVLPPAWAALFVRRDDAAVLRGKIFDQIIELPPALQTETRRFFRIVRFPVYHDGNASAQSIGTIATNVTEQWRDRMELETLNRDLERIVDERTAQYLRAQHDAEAATRAKSEFLANMSHEIRTPLNAIIGLSYLSLNDVHTPKEKQYLQKIHNAGEHLLDTVNSILDFSKIEAGKLTIDNEPFSLRQLIDSVVGVIGQHADNKGLEVRVEIDSQMPSNLSGDSLRIGQILINLCSNAVKFTDAGAITLRIDPLWHHSDSIGVRFSVSDTGIGIAAEHLQTLFQPFHQIDSSSTRRYAGTGLGLMISKSLAELLGGSISVTSTLGVGTRFAIEIPLRVTADSLPDAAPEIASGNDTEQKPLSAQPTRAVDNNALLLPDDLATQRHAPAEALTSPSDLSGAHVLLVEDNAINQEVAIAILRSLGAVVTVANNGLEAIECVHRQTFDAVLMDVQMPLLDGYAATRSIRASADIAQPPIIAMTANAMQGDRDACIAAGMNDYIAKPIRPSELLQTLSRWVRKD